jgi:hypothetical protein
MPKQQTQPSSGSHSQIAQATDALEEARGMPPGSQRIQALKQAGLLRHAADSQGLDLAKRGTSRVK